MALILYGNLDISIIDELPPGEQQIDTIGVNTSYRQRIYAFWAKKLRLEQTGLRHLSRLIRKKMKNGSGKCSGLYGKLKGSFLPGMELPVFMGENESG